MPVVGDLLEIDRCLYFHWAIYVGGGEVVHIVGEDGEDLPDSDVAVVRRDKLVNVVGSDKVRINNKEIRAKDRGLTPLDTDQVLANVRSMVGSKVEYNLLTQNVEHYLTEWKYGTSWSDQVRPVAN